MAMAKTVRLPEQRRRAPAIANLPEEILWEILILLPLKSILRCHSVCKAWHAVTSDHAFLLAHHHCQPPQRLLIFVHDMGSGDDILNVLDYCVEAVNFLTHEFWSVAQFTGQDYDCLLGDNPFIIHASCDGLLLLSYNNFCISATPPHVSGFMSSRPHFNMTRSWGCMLMAILLNTEYCTIEKLVLDLYSTSSAPIGSGKERCIGSHSSSAPLRKWLAKRTQGNEFNGPFLFHGNLHWLPHLGRQNKIVVFDTLDEVFRWLHVPFKICSVASLLKIKGRLAMSNIHVESSKVDLWLLQDYKCGIGSTSIALNCQ